jgi:hypothetical protein
MTWLEYLLQVHNLHQTLLLFVFLGVVTGGGIVATIRKK